jgi:hypothetical protein
MLVPVLLAATTASKALLGADLMHEAGAWTRLLIGYDLVFLIAHSLRSSMSSRPDDRVMPESGAFDRGT